MSKVGQNLNGNLDFWGHLSTFGLELKIHPKVGLFRPKTMPKHSLHNSQTTFKVSRKRPFKPQNGQKRPSEMSKVGQIWTENLDFRDHLTSFGAENTHPKVGLLKPQIMPKYFLNNSRTTILKQSRKRVFRPPKWPKHGCRSGKKCRFLGQCSLYELYFWLFFIELKKKMYPLIAKLIKKKRKVPSFPYYFWEKINTPHTTPQHTTQRHTTTHNKSFFLGSCLRVDPSPHRHNFNSDPPPPINNCNAFCLEAFIVRCNAFSVQYI